jgi:tetratricopeptide (TPR) repeat protein
MSDSDDENVRIEKAYEQKIKERKQSFAKKRTEVPDGTAERAEEKNLAGNEAFQSRNFQAAIDRYSEALAVIGDGSSDAIRKLKKKALLNRAMSHLHKGHWAETETDCTNVLTNFDPRDAKARYRRGQARRRLGKLFDAHDDYVVAARKLPKDRDGRSRDRSCKVQAAIDTLLECGAASEPNPDGLGIPLSKSLKIIIEKGDTNGPAAMRGDKVTAHAVLSLKETKQVVWTTRRNDSSGPHCFTCGRNEVVKGWDRGCMFMKCEQTPTCATHTRHGAPRTSLVCRTEAQSVDPVVLSVSERNGFCKSRPKKATGPRVFRR